MAKKKTNKRSQRPNDRSRKKKAPVKKPKDGRCNHKRADGTYCMRYPSTGREKCSRHGGKALTGPEHPNWKGGRSRSFLTRTMPPRLAERFEAALDDPEILSLRGNLALTLTRLGELIGKLPTKESGELWEDLRTCMVHLRTLIGQEDTEGALDLTENMGEMMNKAIEERRLWGEILNVQEHHRRLADTERKREDQLQSHVTAQQFITAMGYVVRNSSELFDDIAAGRISADGAKVTLADKIKWLMTMGPANPAAYAQRVEVEVDEDQA